MLMMYCGRVERAITDHLAAEGLLMTVPFRSTTIRLR